MVVLTTYRLFAVTNPWKVKELRTEPVLAWIILVWLVAVVIAVIPTADSIRDLFVTSAVVARGRNKLGLLYFQSGTITKISLMDFLQRACMLVFSATLPNFQEVRYCCIKPFGLEEDGCTVSVSLHIGKVWALSNTDLQLKFLSFVMKSRKSTLS